MVTLPLVCFGLTTAEALFRSQSPLCRSVRLKAAIPVSAHSGRLGAVGEGPTWSIENCLRPRLRTGQRRSRLACRARRVLKTSVVAAGALGSAISCRRENGAAWAPGTSRTWKTSRERRAVPRSISIVPISSRRRRRARFVARRPAWRNRTDRRIGAAVELLAVGRRRSRNTW